MAIGIIADHSAGNDFVWEVCDNVDSKNVCQHVAPEDAPSDWYPPHAFYTYGYDPELKGTSEDAEPMSPENQKQNAFNALKANLAPVAPAAVEGLETLTGLI